MNNIHINLSAGNITLKKSNGTDWVELEIAYNSSSKVAMTIKGEDELYALQYLVNRAVNKIENTKPS